ncbi:MAG: hypothetical protein HC913_19780 [Microscillaceae bacterium]|nr:hypothetical protein [Microscillaceae bacterium]
MKKKFNTTGTCYAHLHYLMDNSAKLAQVLQLIEEGSYFTINRPRQYGKTTMLFHITDKLKQNSDYVPILLSFEDIDEHWSATDADLPGCL